MGAVCATVLQASVGFSHREGGTGMYRGIYDVDAHTYLMYINVHMYAYRVGRK